MTVELFFQLLINGLAIGMLYVLIVLGLDLILKTTSIVNFAHGQFYMVGAYIFWLTYFVFQLNVVLALLSSILILGILGLTVYLGIFNFVQRRFTPGQPLSTKLLLSAMASIGLMIIISQGALVSFGAEERGVPSIFPQMITIADVTLPLEKLVVILAALSITLALYLFFNKTKLGKVMRAVSLDAEASSLLGINTFRVYVLGFVLGCGLSGIAGVIVAPVYAITHQMGAEILFIAFLVIVMGGLGSYKGAAIGGLMVGGMMSFGYQFFGGISHVLMFMAVILFLIVRPEGFFGEVWD